MQIATRDNWLQITRSERYPGKGFSEWIIQVRFSVWEREIADDTGLLYEMQEMRYFFILQEILFHCEALNHIDFL